MTMNRFFTIVFGILTVLCLLAVAVAGRLDYLLLAAMCGVAALASRAEMEKERR